jgi:hypothetical protein
VFARLSRHHERHLASGADVVLLHLDEPCLVQLT